MMGKKKSAVSSNSLKRQPWDPHRYELLPHGENIETEEGRRCEALTIAESQAASKWSTFAMGLFAGLIITAISLLLSRRLEFSTKSQNTASGHLEVLDPPGLIPRNFSPQESFKLGSDASDEAWRSIIPEGLGFVQHSHVGPEIVGLAFAHQLHCLDQLRRALDKSHTKDRTPRHVTHCIEYLRSSIMCNADANLEYRKVDPATGKLATPGDDVHLCRGFGELFYFAEKWRVYDGKSVSEKKRIKEDPPGRTIHYDYVSSRGDAVPAK
ncbi:hypothetical protein ACLMJK_006704 [Lecanora helva]